MGLFWSQYKYLGLTTDNQIYDSENLIGLAIMISFNTFMMWWHRYLIYGVFKYFTESDFLMRIEEGIEPWSPEEYDMYCGGELAELPVCQWWLFEN